MLALLVGVAHARPGEPIVVVSADPAFGTALDDALVPAGMAVVAVGDVAPPSIAELSAESRKLADREHATATVWLLPASAGSTLVTYDRGVDRVLVRELPYASPLSTTQAGEAARMVRTMLRALRTPETSDTPVATVKPAIVIAPPPAPWLAASVGIGAWFETPGSALAGMVTLAWRPHGLGVAVSGNFAASAEVMTPSFAGEAGDLVVAVEGRDAFEVRPHVFVAPGVGVALHAFHLRGTLIEGEPMDSRRYDPALRVGVTGLYALPPGIEVGLAVSADTLLLRQRYEVGTEEILVLPRFQVITQLVVGIRL